MTYLTAEPLVREAETFYRPREKMLSKGASCLSDRELAALLINSGQRDRPVEELARSLIDALDFKGGALTLADILSIPGIGHTKGCQIAGAMELFRRRFNYNRQPIKRPGDVYPLIRHYAERLQENFITVSLNGAHEVITSRIVSTGLVNRTLVHPREVFADPITDRAAAVIIAHNHPSGSLEPSGDDRDITRRIKDAGQILGISVLDHLIITKNGYYSFMESGNFC
jgi:DNA repair protein RadC